MLRLGLSLASLLVVGSTVAQELPVYQSTGVIDFTMGDHSSQHHTAWNTWPGEPGREVHTASWTVLEPMLLGGMNIAPDDVLVVIGSRPTIDPTSGQSELRIEISLEPETLQHRTSVPVAVTYHPGEGGEVMTLTDVSVPSLLAERLDEMTFRLQAEIVGVMQTADDGVSEPFSAILDLQQVKRR